MKTCFLAMLSLLVASTSLAQLPYTQEQVTAYAKSIDVHTLDPALPSQRLEDWLQSGPPHVTTLHWLVADTCDLKPDDPNAVDYPLCAKIICVHGGEAAEFLIQVGTIRKGIGARPTLHYGVGTMEAENPLLLTGSSEKLSDLAGLLDQPSVEDEVTSLYQLVVSRHPFGIPEGDDRKAFAPYLSKSLLQRFDIADACFEDWNRKHPDPNAKPPGLEDGLFTGDDLRAEPQSFEIEGAQTENDLSTLVNVKLTRDDPSGRRWVWRVAVILTRENGHFVVDDVIWLKDNPQGVDVRLSQYLSGGCDGPHWVGDSAQQNAQKPQNK